MYVVRRTAVYMAFGFIVGTNVTETTTSTTNFQTSTAKNPQSLVGGPGGLVGGLKPMNFDSCIADCENPGFGCHKSSQPPLQDATSTRPPDIPWFDVFFGSASAVRESNVLVFVTCVFALGSVVFREMISRF